MVEVMGGGSLSPAEARAACCCQFDGKRAAITDDARAGSSAAGAGAAWAAADRVMATVVVLEEPIRRADADRPHRASPRSTATAGAWSAATPVDGLRRTRRIGVAAGQCAGDRAHADHGEAREKSTCFQTQTPVCDLPKPATVADNRATI